MKKAKNKLVDGEAYVRYGGQYSRVVNSNIPMKYGMIDRFKIYIGCTDENGIVRPIMLAQLDELNSRINRGLITYEEALRLRFKRIWLSRRHTYRMNKLFSKWYDPRN